MNKERLLRLAEHLDKLPPEKFYFGSFVGKDWDGKSDILTCGTTACAIGHATLLPDMGIGKMQLNCLGYPVIDGKTPFDAALVAFDISRVEAQDLFIPGCSKLNRFATAKDVASHIHTFVKRKGSST